MVCPSLFFFPLFLFSSTTGQGECISSSTGVDSYCKCFHPYTGPSCAASLCPNHCGGKGKCTATGCQCSPGWSGDECQKPTCSRLNDWCVVWKCFLLLSLRRHHPDFFFFFSFSSLSPATDEASAWTRVTGSVVASVSVTLVLNSVKTARLVDVL